MNIIRKVFQVKKSTFLRSIVLPKPNRQFKSIRRYLSSKSNVGDSGDDVLNEDLFWGKLRTSLNVDEYTKRAKDNELVQAEKRVFVLQLRMQYKSKSRQSTTPELQLAESISLVETLRNWKCVGWYIVGAKHTYTQEIFGEGNQELLSKKIGASGANCLFIVIDHLTINQTEALRRTLLGNNPQMSLYDRYKLVLEIFKQNAKSEIAKLQIALAEIPYIRNKYENIELYKQVEKKIKRELEYKLKTRQLQSSERRSSRRQMPIVAVFGYTNVGKTSFIKSLTGDPKLQPENKLFATLDISYHGTAMFDSTQNVLFADTIGFIADIPFNLVEAFKTTLQDALDADMYVHVIDVSHPDRVTQERTVNEILGELGEPKKIINMVVVYNKSDKMRDKNDDLLIDDDTRFLVSSKTGHGIEKVREKIENSLIKQLGYIEINLEVPQGGDELAYLYKHAIIREIHENPNNMNNVVVNVFMNKTNALKFVNLFPNIKISK